MAIGIYWIRNRENGKFYIGSSTNVQQRWREHKSHLIRNIHGNKHLQNAWNLYGTKAFSFQILEIVNAECLLDVERWYLKHTRCCDREHGYNILVEPLRPDNKGEKHPLFGKHHSVVSRKKMSQSRLLNGVPLNQYKPIIQLSANGEVLSTFPSLQSAALSLNLKSSSHITMAAKGRRNTAYGYKWRYADAD